MRLRTILLVLLVFLIGAVFVYRYVIDDTEPEIIRNIPTSDREQASSMFNVRVAKQFPIGSDVKTLVEFLISNKFKQTYRFDQWKSASLVDGVICPSYWRIQWQSDENGQIKYIKGNWDNDCY